MQKRNSLPVAAGVAALILAVAIAPSSARATCTEQDQEAKMNELSGMLAVLAQKNDPRAQKIAQDMQTAATQEGDQACATYDKLIKEAK